MAHKGKLQRGELWWNKRNRDGGLPPGIKNDTNKMADIDYFLASQKKPEPKPVPKKKEEVK